MNITRFRLSSFFLSLISQTVLIMDEVDGMSGGDRGGMQELYSLIKATKVWKRIQLLERLFPDWKSQVPIICICNDRSSPKVKTLANYCIDLRFRRCISSFAKFCSQT